jgi:hypothetical protein
VQAGAVLILMMESRRSVGSAARYWATVEAVIWRRYTVQRSGRKYSFGARSDDVTNVT